MADPPLTCVIDANIFDRIVDEPGMLDLVCALTGKGALRLYATSVQVREVRATPSADRRARLLEVPVETVATTPAVYGYATYGDRYGKEEPYRTLRGNSTRHVPDHLGVATAEAGGFPFVTEEKKLRKHAEDRAGVEAWSWEELRSRIERLN